MGCTPGRSTGPADQGVKGYLPQRVDKEVDILFVVDNAVSMGEEQQALAKSFPSLVEALRSTWLNNKIPNLHIGIVTTDLGAGSYTMPSCELLGGDGGKLTAKPRVAGCVPPTNPWIDYNEGVTNIKSATSDPILQVKEAFQCIAEVGTGGCGFQQTLEAARRALTGCGTDANNDRLGDCSVNPGFIRKDALLVVALVTDEDDCSAQKPQLFDPSQTSLTDPLGPLGSFRCFEFGIQCDINDRTQPGPRKGCKPAYDWLYRVEDYVAFFKGLKPPGRVLLFALAGPVEPVEVGMDGQKPVLRPSCPGIMGKATPAIRLAAVTDGLGKRGLFNRGIDADLTQEVPVSVCSPDYGPALRLLGRTIVGVLHSRCLEAPPLTASGGLVCKQGDAIGPGVTCATSCLERAVCTVVDVETGWGSGLEEHTVVQKCAASKFTNPSDTSCGAVCPCWRIGHRADECLPTDSSPFSVEVLRKLWSPSTKTSIQCKTSSHAWGSAQLAALPQCS